MPILPLMLPGRSTPPLPPPLIPARPIALPLPRSRHSTADPSPLHPHTKQQQGDIALYSLVVPQPSSLDAFRSALPDLLSRQGVPQPRGTGTDCSLGSSKKFSRGCHGTFFVT